MSILGSGIEESITAKELKDELVKLDDEMTSIKPFSIRVGYNDWRTAKIDVPIAAAM